MDFYAIYVREAHPIDGWGADENENSILAIKQHRTFEERVTAAESCCEAMKLQIPLLVDGIDNAVCKSYSGHPDRLYVINREGKIAYKGGRGPFGFMPGQLEQVLVQMLIDQDSSRK